jgi:hypothetical protein
LGTGGHPRSGAPGPRRQIAARPASTEIAAPVMQQGRTSTKCCLHGKVPL